MNIFLKKTDLNNFVHHLCNGEQIVRNPKINALIVTKLVGIPAEYQKILANPVFTGTQSHESIMWQTDQFTIEPTPLNELHGSDRIRYESILHDVMERYASAVRQTKEPTLDILTKAITYHSLDNIFCAEDKIVITEWGMHPKDKPDVNWLPLGVDVNPPCQFEGAGQDSHNNENMENSEQPEITSDELKTEENSDLVNDNEEEEKNNSFDNNDDVGSDIHSQSNSSNANEHNKPTFPPVVPPVSGGNDDGGGNKTPTDKTSFWRRWKNWILGILALLFALLVILLCLNRCEKDPVQTISPISPDINPEDISLSEDSLTMEVNNRVILLIMKGGTVNEFVKEFRKVYPDEAKYQFANPDTIIPRVVLILPKEEKKDFIETLTEKFPNWELEVMPETLFKNSSVSVNDPAFTDVTKRWYFDMCSVFDAWDVTMGSEDITVAVIDDGFDLSHPEIAGKVIGQYNAVYHNTNIFPSAVGHGMHVAATAVGLANNGHGLAGIAPKCKLMPIQVADRNGVMVTSAIFDGVLYAIQQGADVVNMSLGMSFSPLMQFVPVPIQRNFIINNFLSEERVWKKIFDLAEEHHVTFVLAGGNENILIGLDPMQRSNKTIKVSAVQPNKYKANFSNYGDYSTLSAPGVQIYNAIPGNNYTYMDGTSMASPVVAGGVALLKSKDKSLSTGDIIKILRETGIPSPSDVGPIVNFAKALNADPAEMGGDCDEYQHRYNELLEELERLKKSHPDCIAEPDTLTIPENATLTDITGTWMSTTRLYNQEDEDVVLYFTFNGSSSGTLTLVEPDKSRYIAPLSVSIKDDKIFIKQTAPATGPKTTYPPYSFVCKPDKKRHADCSGQNLIQASNKISFRLIRLNN